MATIKYGPIIQSARGSLGGLVFARTGGTSCVRQRPIVRQVQSQAALQSQAFYPAVVSAWRNLTTAQRTAWVRAAQVYQHSCPDGTTRPISPWLMFATVNLRRLNMNAYYLQTGVGSPWTIASLPVFEPGSLETVSADLRYWPEGTVEFYHAGPSSTLSPCYSLSVQRCWRASPTRPGRLVKLLYHGQPSTHCQDLTTLSAALIGTPPIGESVYWECVSHMAAWPASIKYSGLITVPNLGPNLLSNADFESPAAPAVPTGWSAAGSGTLVTETTDVGKSLQSVHWQRTSAGADSHFYSPYSIPILASSDQFFFFGQTKPVSAFTTYFRIQYPSSSEFQITVALPQPDDLWHTISGTSTGSHSVTTARLHVIRLSSAVFDGFLDNLQIRKVL